MFIPLGKVFEDIKTVSWHILQAQDISLGFYCCDDFPLRVCPQSELVLIAYLNTGTITRLIFAAVLFGLYFLAKGIISADVELSQQYSDMIRAFFLILSIAVSAVLGAGFTNCIIALAIGLIPGYARMTRASILNVRRMEYLEAANIINASTFRIITRHVLPNAIAPLIVSATMGVATSILVAASLSFIGLGVQPPTPEWGAMLSAGRSFIRNHPHLVLFPGLTIMTAVLSLNMLGDGLRDALDPKLKD